jgi:hypothetical protein
MMSERYMSEAELNVLEGKLPERLKPAMRDVALCLFEALVLSDERCGRSRVEGDWLVQLQAWAAQALMQLQHLASQKGGFTIYLSKGISVHLSERDHKMCTEFRGDYDVLALKYGLTPMRVRQIVDAWQRARFLDRQQSLDGLDDPDDQD